MTNGFFSLKNIQLLKGLINGEMAYTGPSYISIAITRHCNMHCLGCQYHSSETRMAQHSNYNADSNISLELVQKLCGELPGLDTHEVFLLGQGEPLLHPHLGHIISAFKQAGCKVQLFSNGTLIDKTKAHMLLDSGLDVLRVSLWAITPEEYKKCYPEDNLENLQKTLEGIRTIHNMKAYRGTTLPSIILTTPLNRYNYRSIEDRIRLAYDLGCDGVYFDVYQHWGEFTSDALSTEEINTVCKKLTSIRTVLKSLSLTHNIDEILLRYSLGETAWQKLPCYVGWFHTRIAVDGSVIPCSSCTIPLGNLTESSMEEIWNGPEYRKFRKNMLVPGGTASLSSYCHCGWCCRAKSNFRVHRFFKWVAPFLRKRNILMSN